jgi:hypothetical protein
MLNRKIALLGLPAIAFLIGSDAEAWGFTQSTEYIAGWAGGKGDHGAETCFGDDYGAAINVCPTTRTYMMPMGLLNPVVPGGTVLSTKNVNITVFGDPEVNCFVTLNALNRSYNYWSGWKASSFSTSPSHELQLSPSSTHDSHTGEIVCTVPPNKRVQGARSAYDYP